MAYTSPRRPTRRKPYKNQNAGRVVLGLLLLGLAVYFVTVSAAGNWVAQNVVAPLFQAASPEPTPGKTAQSGQIAVVDDPVVIDSANEAASTPAPTSGGKSQQLRVEAFTAYCLQMGAFSSEENARREADNLRARGAGGYVLFEGGHYRVLASAYDSQDEIQRVREQLKTDNIESGIYKIEMGEVNLKITASDAQAKAFANAINTIASTRRSLKDAVTALDRGEVTAEASAEALRALQSELQTAQNELKDATKGAASPVLDALDQWFTFTRGELSALSENTANTTLDFSAQMKYTHIAVICETRKFVQQIETK